VANGLWAQTNFPFLPAFLANASDNFDASVQQVDFETDALQITDQINEWVADQTDGMISNLLQPGTLNPSFAKGGKKLRFFLNRTHDTPDFIGAVFKNGVL